MHIVKYNRFPNNEIRVTHYYKGTPREKPEISAATSNVTSIPDCASEPDGEVESLPSLNLTLGGISLSGDSSLPFRKTKFGTNAKNTLLRIGGAYDTLSTKPCDFIFLTGTLPGNTPAAFRAIAEYSSYIADSLGNWLQRTVKSKYYFYTWELQKRGALHFHYCVYCPNDEAKQKILSSFKTKWTALLDDIGARANTCMWEGDSRTCWADRYGTLQAYAQPVHTSVAAYLAGYLGGSKDKHAQDENSPYYPRRWWGASRATTTLLKGLTETIEIEHPSYRGARHEIEAHYEAALHDTPHCHRYNHKVGVGSTVVSYHPEDKGLSLWQGLQRMTLQHKHHPHIASLIRMCAKIHVMAHPYVRKLKTSKNPASVALSRSWEDSGFWRALQRWTLQDGHLALLRTVSLHLPTPTPADHHLLELRRCLALTGEFLTLNQGHLRFNQYGWLSNPEDLPYTVDFSKNVMHLSTNEPDGSDAQGGAAHGSISPQNSPSQLSLF